VFLKTHNYSVLLANIGKELRKQADHLKNSLKLIIIFDFTRMAMQEISAYWVLLITITIRQRVIGQITSREGHIT